jgi:hypothetical protein
MEADLRSPVHVFFEERHYSVFDEVRLFSRKIDVIARRRNEITSVELKTRDWRRAIHQAFLDLSVSDYSFIALPHSTCRRIETSMLNEALNYGIGILRVDGVAIQIIKPKRNGKIQPHLRRRFLKGLRGS